MAKVLKCNLTYNYRLHFSYIAIYKIVLVKLASICKWLYTYFMKLPYGSYAKIYPTSDSHTGDSVFMQTHIHKLNADYYIIAMNCTAGCN